jgi:hypothetical protein
MGTTFMQTGVYLYKLMGKHFKILAFSDSVNVNIRANPFQPDGLTVTLMYVLANQLCTERHHPEVETWVSFIITVCVQPKLVTSEM